MNTNISVNNIDKNEENKNNDNDVENIINTTFTPSTSTLHPTDPSELSFTNFCKGLYSYDSLLAKAGISTSTSSQRQHNFTRNRKYNQHQLITPPPLSPAELALGLRPLHHALIRTEAERYLYENSKHSQKESQKHVSNTDNIHNTTPTSASASASTFSTAFYSSTIYTNYLRTSLQLQTLLRIIIQPLTRLTVAMLPEDTSSSVHPSYLPYSSLQFLANSLGSAASVVSTQALLTAVGLSSTSAIPVAAALNWIMKDAIGQIGASLYAASLSTQFDIDPKHQRVLALSLYNGSSLLEILTPLFPAFFLPLAAIGNIGKNISWMSIAATRAASHMSFMLHKKNLADITVKASAQSTAAGVIGTSLGAFLSFLYSPYQKSVETGVDVEAGTGAGADIDVGTINDMNLSNDVVTSTLQSSDFLSAVFSTSFIAPLTLFTILATLQLYLVHKSMRHVHINTLNKQRLELIYRSLFQRYYDEKRINMIYKNPIYMKDIMITNAKTKINTDTDIDTDIDIDIDTNTHIDTHRRNLGVYNIHPGYDIRQETEYQLRNTAVTKADFPVITKNVFENIDHGKTSMMSTLSLKTYFDKADIVNDFSDITDMNEKSTVTHLVEPPTALEVFSVQSIKNQHDFSVQNISQQEKYFRKYLGEFPTLCTENIHGNFTRQNMNQFAKLGTVTLEYFTKKCISIIQSFRNARYVAENRTKNSLNNVEHIIDNVVSRNTIIQKLKKNVQKDKNSINMSKTQQKQIHNDNRKLYQIIYQRYITRSEAKAEAGVENEARGATDDIKSKSKSKSILSEITPQTLSHDSIELLRLLAIEPSQLPQIQSFSNERNLPYYINFSFNTQQIQKYLQNIQHNTGKVSDKSDKNGITSDKKTQYQMMREKYNKYVEMLQILHPRYVINKVSEVVINSLTLALNSIIIPTREFTRHVQQSIKTMYHKNIDSISYTFANMRIETMKSIAKSIKNEKYIQKYTKLGIDNDRGYKLRQQQYQQHAISPPSNTHNNLSLDNLDSLDYQGGKKVSEKMALQKHIPTLLFANAITFDQLCEGGIHDNKYNTMQKYWLLDILTQRYIEDLENSICDNIDGLTKLTKLRLRSFRVWTTVPEPLTQVTIAYTPEITQKDEINAYGHSQMLQNMLFADIYLGIKLLHQCRYDLNENEINDKYDSSEINENTLLEAVIENIKTDEATRNRLILLFNNQYEKYSTTLITDSYDELQSMIYCLSTQLESSKYTKYTQVEDVSKLETTTETTAKTTNVNSKTDENSVEVDNNIIPQLIQKYGWDIQSLYIADSQNIPGVKLSIRK